MDANASYWLVCTEELILKSYWKFFNKEKNTKQRMIIPSYVFQEVQALGLAEMDVVVSMAMLIYDEGLFLGGLAES